MSWCELFMVKWPDALWHIIPGLAVYQILGTVRHELAHAVACWLAGYKVTLVRVLPHMYRDKFYWGRIAFEPQGGARYSIHMHLAPYEVGAVAVAIWFAVVRFAPPPWVADERMAWHLWAMFTLMFLISPIVDFLYNLGKMIFAKRGDLYKAVRFWETH